MLRQFTDYAHEVVEHWAYDRIQFERRQQILTTIEAFREGIGSRRGRGTAERWRTMDETNMDQGSRFPAPNAKRVQRIFIASVGQGELGGHCPDDFRNSWLEFIIGQKIYARLPLPLIWSHRAATFAELMERKDIPENTFNFQAAPLEIDTGEHFYAQIRSMRERTASKAHDFFIVLEGAYARGIQ